MERPIELDLGVSIYAFGYSRTVPFAAMPKIHVKWFLGRLHVFDQEKLIVDAPVKVHTTSTHIIFAIPWKLLGEPQLVFAQANGLMREIPVSQTAWEVLMPNSFQTPANIP